MKARLSDSVYAATEQERHRREVEFVAKHDAQWIKEHLAGVQERRGFEAYQKLINDVLKGWKNK